MLRHLCRSDYINFGHMKLKLINYFRITRELVIVSHSLFVIIRSFKKNKAIKTSYINKYFTAFTTYTNRALPCKLFIYYKCENGEKIIKFAPDLFIKVIMTQKRQAASTRFFCCKGQNEYFFTGRNKLASYWLHIFMF